MKIFAIALIFIQSMYFATASDISHKSTNYKDLESTYYFNSLSLNKGEFFDIAVSKEYGGLSLDFISITHRQSPSEESECPSFSDKDCFPSYTSVEVLNENNEWRYWAGKGSGPYNSKFAEIRSRKNGETDNLYHWMSVGHIGFEQKDYSRAAIYPKIVRVRNLGPDSSRIEKLVIKFNPKKVEELREVLFSQEFQFGDYITALGEKLPKSSYYGDYKNPLTLSPHSIATHKNLPGNWKVKKGQIQIPICCQKNLVFVDVAIGDMRYTTGGGSLDDYRGSARLTINVVYPDLTIKPLMKSENIGSTGVLRASPEKISESIPDGSFLTITVENDVAQIMGIRIGFDHAKTK